MLKAIEERLKRLAADENRDFHNQIQCRIGKRATQLLEQRLRNLIHLIPRLLSQALRHSDRNEIPSELKKLIGFLLTYLYHPKDFLAEDNRSLFGYLDDAYGIALAYERVLRALQKSGVRLDSDDESFMKQFALMKRSVKAVIPDEAQKISEMIANILKGNNESFYAALV